MISAPLRVPAPKAAAGGSFLLGASSVESNPNPKLKPSRVRCAAAAAATLYEVLGLRAGTRP